jgi:aromatic ring hydroxylase
LRTGADYRAALRDGRKVWVTGVGAVDDVTTHAATRDMVDQYVAWYDRHRDPAWQDVLLAPPDGAGARLPWAFVLPTRADELVAMGRAIARVAFLSAGNITHTPGYGHLIALGVLAETQTRGVSPAQVANAEAYRRHLVETQRFLTFSAGTATIGYRMRPDPALRAALRIVRETDAGLVVRGKIGMHTSPAYAEDVYVGSFCGLVHDQHPVSFVVPVNAPGVTVVCRRISARDDNRFSAPLSSRYDELDGQMWLDDVHVPWERLFYVDASPDPIARWLFWHQLHGWLAKAEFTLGLAFACAHAMGLTAHEATIDYLIDLMIDVQTVRSCQTAAERDPQVTAAGYCHPNTGHVAAGSIAMLKARAHMSELVRVVPGSSLVLAPTDRDLASPEVGAGLEETFAGGGYTALQRAALLQLAWDHVSSALDARESAFELHANGGLPAWRGRLRRAFDRYNELANGVLRQLDLAMPEIDLASIKAAPLVPRRPVEVRKP